MAGEYMYTEEAAAQAAPSRLEKGLKWFILAACIAVGAELVWLLGITPFMPFSKVNVSAAEGLSRESLLAYAGVSSQSSFISLNARTSEKALRALPQIESAFVFKHFPDKLEIVLKGREAAAVAFASLKGKMVPVFFDSHGIIFRIGHEGKADASAELPVISGLVIEEPYPGMRLPAMFNSLFQQLDTLRIKTPELLAAVSEIKINRKSFDGFDLILYPIHKQIRVRLSELNQDLLRYTLLMADVLAAREPGINFIDFRSGMASYTLKEASSE
ncbi:putative cell division protein FtsQ [Leadbettera azotonutricia ZAS-9]|uniref:Putative cell division protein FtsQ n=2 Tax=Leadbettera azotonutricia TaxID=150829 RepID=F5Y8Y0_LEAAZ|nr:putative cell division protein FtsQ [Leadbettera azotonutricia ZAS-9]